MTFRVNVRGVAIRLPRFTQDEMRAFGERSIAVEKERILAGKNIHDAPAKRLSQSYVRLKQRRGGAPIRDLRLTGALLASMSVTRASENSVRTGFTADEQIKARVNQERERQIGLSPLDQAAVMQRIREEYRSKFKR